MDRLSRLGLSAAAAFVLVLGAERPAKAQTFPTTWQPILRAGLAIQDPPEVLADLQRDVVGDAQNPSVYLASDADHLFFRIRVNGDPRAAPPAPDLHETSGWGCVIDTDNDFTKFEYLLMLDGHGGDSVSWRSNSPKGLNSLDVADTELGSFGASFHRFVTANSNIGGHADTFVDFAVPWSAIRGGAAPIAEGTVMRFVCGTHNGDANSALPSNSVNADLADGIDGRGPLGFSDRWSEPYTCNTAGVPACTLQDTDGDGIPDVVEGVFGTDPTKTDTDGDGIPDPVELTAQGAAAGSGFSAVNTDGDGLIDALDTDSDGDGLLDADEGAVLDTDSDGVPNYRDDDDDGDSLKTKDEIAAATQAQLSDDIDADGIKNWLDTDSDGDGQLDIVEGLDRNGNTIPDYLEKAVEPPPDAAPPPPPPPPPPPSSSSGDPVSNPFDAGADADSGPVILPISDGVIQGTGLFCSSTVVGHGSTQILGVFAGLAAALAARRSHRRRGGLRRG